MVDMGFVLAVSVLALTAIIGASLYGWLATHARDERQVARRLRQYVGRQ